MKDIKVHDVYIPVDEYKPTVSGYFVDMEGKAMKNLELHSNVIILSKEDFIKAIGASFDNGVLYSTGEMHYNQLGKKNSFFNKEQYIDNLIK